MLNESDPSANRSTANGSTTLFAYGFKIDNENDLAVWDNDTLKTINTHYTVTGVGVSGGGNVVFLTAPLNGHIIARLRKQTLEQQSDYIANESFPNARVEADFDALVMIAQELKEAIGRALKFKKSSSLVDQSVDEPVVGSFARAKAGGGIDWASVVIAGSISVPATIAQGGTNAITAAAALTSLGAMPLAGGVFSGAVSSTKSVATGYVRVTPNFCKPIVPIINAYTPNTACTAQFVDANLPTNKVAMIKLRWKAISANGTGARPGLTNFSGGDSACTLTTASSTFSAYEQAAVAAGTTIREGSDIIFATTNAGYVYAKDLNGGGNGTSVIVSLESLGYFD